jgi:hypothetical protein
VRLVDWYLGLTTGQKVVVGTASFVLVIAFTYLASIVILLAAGAGPEDTPPQQGRTPAPASPTPSPSASASPSDSTILEIEGARWEGDRAVVEGTWQGGLSSVHCGLLEGSRSGQAIDWWDRSVAAKTSFPDRTFSQEFVRASGNVKDPIDPKGEYWATCWGQFSDGLVTGDDAAVKGMPPAG